MEYSNDMQHVYRNLEEYNPGIISKTLIVFDDMIADMINNKKLNKVVTELFIRGRKINISFVFFIMEIPDKRKLQQFALNHSSDIDFKDFMKIYKRCTAEAYSFLVNDITLASDNPLKFRKNLLK